MAYRVRNWKDYNKYLINRGRITFWIDENTSNWYLPKNDPKKRGRPMKYSDSAIRTMLIIKHVYHLTLRNCQGFVESLFRLMELSIKVPCYTRICRRQKSILLPKLPVRSESIHIVIDSSGLKLFGEGEWKVRQHGWTKHRMWRKLHIGLDEKSQLIVCAKLTRNSSRDDKQLPALLNQYQGQIFQVSADGAYDSHRCYDDIARRGAKPTIPSQEVQIIFDLL